ncbi:hypothetical protein APD05_01895 [Acinetobacter nosocomialis]|uniref:hypothetical protein n=1 Tax=Acinetobacter nosocomialis TaxID=106654 RepID=UPI000707AC5A|nr:hypothetical protein [Acinetobacter nosocomialis]KQD15103.1 hypothetical protein APD05_01895 [Acinetobacter nosocomialis]
MQNDSNVETTQAEIKPFPRQLISDMLDSNVTFDTILHIPTLLASSSEQVSDKFQEFLDDAYEEWQSSLLLEQCPALKSTLKEIRENNDIKHYAGEVLQDFHRACGDFEFLIEIEIRIPFNFRFDKDGKYQSNSLGGYFRVQWILAKNMVDAAQIAIKIAEELHSVEEAKARKEQGLEAQS